jgi:hypothetical protein
MHTLCILANGIGDPISFPTHFAVMKGSCLHTPNIEHLPQRRLRSSDRAANQAFALVSGARVGESGEARGMRADLGCGARGLVVRDPRNNLSHSRHWLFICRSRGSRSLFPFFSSNSLAA